MSKEDSKKTLLELIDEADQIYSFFYKFSKKRKDSRPLYEEAFKKAKSEKKELEMDYTRGKIALIDNEFDDALQYFDNTTKKDKNFLRGWLYKGVALDYLNKFDEALKCYDKALKIDPKHVIALNNKAIAFKKIGKFDEALKYYDKSLKLDPMHSRAWYNKGNILSNLGRYDEALKCYNKALEINPEYDTAFNNKGVTLDYLGRYDEALKCYNKSLEINPEEAVTWYNKGKSLSELERYDEALKCYNKALEINPEYTNVLNNKGNILSNLGRYDEALKCYNKALEIDPEYASAWNNKAVALELIDKYDEALKCYNKALEIDPEYDLAKDNRFLVLTRLGRNDEVDEELEEFYSKLKEDIEKSEVSEEETKEKFLELDAQKEVRKELGTDLELMLNEKKNYEDKLAKSLEPRSEPLKDDFFIVLRRWNSYTPTMITSTESNLGGGYFLYWKGKGVVIDPGFDFLTNFFSNGLLVHDIDAVIITHAHIDHCNDFESLLTLIYKYNKENNKDKKIDVFMNLGAMKKFLGWIPIEKDDKDPKINRIYSLEEGITINLEDYQMRIIPKKAIHNEILSKCYSVGVVLELYDKDYPDKTFSIGYTSDTRHNEEVEEQYNGVNIIIPNMGSIERLDIQAVEDKNLKKDKNHLMLTGVISAIYKSNAKLAIISEFGEELGAQRVKIVNALNNVFQANGRTRCMTGDIGLTVKIPEFDDLENLQVRCAICSYRNNKELYDKLNKRPAYCCFEGNEEVYVELKNILEGLDPQNKPEKSVIDFCENCKPSYEIL